MVDAGRPDTPAISRTGAYAVDWYYHGNLCQSVVVLDDGRVLVDLEQM